MLYVLIDVCTGGGGACYMYLLMCARVEVGLICVICTY